VGVQLTSSWTPFSFQAHWARTNPSCAENGSPKKVERSGRAQKAEKVAQPPRRQQDEIIELVLRGPRDCLRQWLPDETVLPPSQDFDFGLGGPRKRG
jgi:hypothetical protein